MKKRKQNTLRVVLTLAHKFEKRNIDLFVPFENRKKKQLNNGEQYWPSGHVWLKSIYLPVFLKN